MSEEEPFGNLIYSYTRKQAIEDGVLIDISSIARMVGFRLQFCINVSVYEAFKDELVRLLTQLSNVVMSQKPKSDRLYFSYKGMELVFVIHPDDDDFPCFTMCEPRDL